MSFVVEEELPNNHPAVVERGLHDSASKIRISFNERPTTELSCFDIITDRECMVALRNHFVAKPQRQQVWLERLSTDRSKVWMFRTPRFPGSLSTEHDAAGTAFFPQRHVASN